MNINDFDYDLPRDLIAQTPIEPRDNSRLMILSKSGNELQHTHFFNLTDFLRPGDLLVFNDSRVMPARLHGTRINTGTKIELLLLHRIPTGLWRTLVRPGRHMKPGDSFQVSNGRQSLTGEVIGIEDDGTRLVDLSNEEYINEIAVIPLPPYIHQPLENHNRYQTVYARASGSVAAPTAGLHFTMDLLNRICALGAEVAFVTLHVGWDSFRPIRSEDVESHNMHSEYYEIPQKTADAINLAKRNRRRIISVGTTATRALEHAALKKSKLPTETITPSTGWANLFIYQGFQFQVVEALITNFHLPKSTLLMLTSALAGRKKILHAYTEAVSEGYRFYSFGDAMFII